MASRGDIKIEKVQPKLLERWAKLGIEETIDKSGAFVKLKSKDYFENGKFPVVDQGDKFISGYVNDKSLLYQGELPVIIFGDHTRNVKYVDFPFAAAADGTKILKPKSFYNSKFYHYYFKSLSVPNLGYSRHFSILKEIEFPLPPLAEQNRIVAKLDALFLQHETIKKSIEKIPELLKNFRQQVLTQAVTGKLTEEWRKGKRLGNGIKIVNIEYLVKSLKTDIRTGPFGSALKKDEHKNSGVPIWGIESIGLNGKFTGITKIFVTEEKAKNLKSFEVKGGNIIISRSGTVGELCILPNDVEYGLISTNLMKIILNNEIIISKYFCWLFKGSPMVIEKLNDLCKGSTRLFLTQSILKNLDFPLPSLQEQQEIVSRVESLFDIADNIELQYKTLKAKIDTLPKAILHKAFKGELSEQLDTDGDASELLKQIQELKNSAIKPKKATNKKTKKYSEVEKVLGMVAKEQIKIQKSM